MATVFDSELFKKVILTTRKSVEPEIVEIWDFTTTLKQSRGDYLAQLLRQESKGTLKGRIIKIKKDLEEMPLELPNFFVPGLIFKTLIDGLEVSLTVKPKFQSRIRGLNEILGLAVEFDYVVSSEFL